MDQRDIERIVHEQGLLCSLRNYVSYSGKGRSTIYFYAGTGRDAMRSLGRIEKVMELSEAQLVQRLTELPQRKQGKD